MEKINITELTSNYKNGTLVQWLENQTRML